MADNYTAPELDQRGHAMQCGLEPARIVPLSLHCMRALQHMPILTVHVMRIITCAAASLGDALANEFGSDILAPSGDTAAAPALVIETDMIVVGLRLSGLGQGKQASAAAPRGGPGPAATMQTSLQGGSLGHRCLLMRWATQPGPTPGTCIPTPILH